MSGDQPSVVCRSADGDAPLVCWSGRKETSTRGDATADHRTLSAAPGIRLRAIRAGRSDGRSTPADTALGLQCLLSQVFRRLAWRPVKLSAGHAAIHPTAVWFTSDCWTNRQPLCGPCRQCYRASGPNIRS